MTNSTQPQKSFFNLTAKGIGWINRIRDVKKGRHTFYACTFNALRVRINRVVYSLFDKSNFVVSRRGLSYLMICEV